MHAMPVSPASASSQDSPTGRIAVPWARLGWRTLWRDLRAGELRLLMVAVTLAVAALTSVGFFADRLQGGLARDALQLLGGDAVVASDNPTPVAFVEQARALGLTGVTTLSFPTMGRAPDLQGGASRLPTRQCRPPPRRPPRADRAASPRCLEARGPVTVASVLHAPPRSARRGVVTCTLHP